MLGAGLLRRIQNFTPGSSPITIYKSFLGPQLDYVNVIYDQLSNVSLSS